MKTTKQNKKRDIFEKNTNSHFNNITTIGRQFRPLNLQLDNTYTHLWDKILKLI